MSKALKSADSRMGGIVFELDRFEFAEGDGCELQGRWFGVRGRRFMRPALTLIADGQQTRLLADLAHKPWDAQDGAPWQAAFQGQIENATLVAAELTVAPDITISLPAPKPGQLATGAVGPARRGRVPRSRAGDSQGKAGARSTGRRDATQPTDRTALRGGLGMLTRELAETARELRQSKRALAAAEREKAQAAGRLQAATAELERITQEHEETQREREDIAAERDLAQRSLDLATEKHETTRSALERANAERDAALNARAEMESQVKLALDVRNQAESERDAARAAREQVESRYEAALRERDRAVLERDAAFAARDDAESRCAVALGERDQAAADRDRALVARDDAASRSEAMRSTLEALQTELADEKAARGAALVMRHATQVRRQPDLQTLLLRMLPLMALVAIAVVVLIALGVV